MRALGSLEIQKKLRNEHLDAFAAGIFGKLAKVRFFTWAVIKTVVTLHYASCFFWYPCHGLWNNPHMNLGRIIPCIYPKTTRGLFFVAHCFCFFSDAYFLSHEKIHWEKNTIQNMGPVWEKLCRRTWIVWYIYTIHSWYTGPTWIVDFYGKLVGKYTVQLKPTKRRSSSPSTSRSRPQESASDVDKLTSVVFTMPGHYGKLFFPGFYPEKFKENESCWTRKVRNVSR